MVQLNQLFIFNKKQILILFNHTNLSSDVQNEYNFFHLYMEFQKEIINFMRDNIFDEIVRTYYQSIYKYCYIKLRDKYAAEDCTQEVFLVMHKKREKLIISENIKSWLYKTAQNIIKNYIKNNIEFVPIEKCENISQPENMNEETAFEGIISQEEEKLLTAYYIDGTDIGTISDMTNTSEAALYKRLQRIRKKILKSKGEKE